MGEGKVEFLQGTNVVSTMDVDLKAGMNRFQWNMRGPAPAAGDNGCGCGRWKRRQARRRSGRCGSGRRRSGGCGVLHHQRGSAGCG